MIELTLGILGILVGTWMVLEGWTGIKQDLVRFLFRNSPHERRIGRDRRSL